MSRCCNCEISAPPPQSAGCGWSDSGRLVFDTPARSTRSTHLPTARYLLLFIHQSYSHSHRPHRYRSSDSTTIDTATGRPSTLPHSLHSITPIPSLPAMRSYHTIPMVVMITLDCHHYSHHPLLYTIYCWRTTGSGRGLSGFI